MPISRLLTLLTFFFIGNLQVALAQHEVTPGKQNSSSADWSITFDLEETFRGDPLPRIIHLQIDSAGKYIANYRLVSDNQDAAKLHMAEGIIEEKFASHLKDWLSILKESNLSASEQEINLGFAPTLTPGWRGSLLVQQLENKTAVKFNSLRAEGEERPKIYNQLATFIFDLKRFTLAKFDLDTKPAVNPDDAQ